MLINVIKSRNGSNKGEMLTQYPDEFLQDG